MQNSYTVYFGGELFDHKDLIGNALLASYIEKISKGTYTCFLPQSLDQADATALEIRNQDLKKIIECDLELFNFEGTEVDSGTVVEFIFAKFLDIPSVILRSDFRSSGEKELGGDDWNLMCSFYPRTEIVQFNAMAYYQDAIKESGSLNEAMDCLYTKVATTIIKAFEVVIKLDPVFKGNEDQLKNLYQWAITFPGGGLNDLFSRSLPLAKIVSTKADKQLV